MKCLYISKKQFLDKCLEELFHFLNSWVESHVDSKHMFQCELMDKDSCLCNLNHFYDGKRLKKLTLFTNIGTNVLTLDHCHYQIKFDAK